MLEENIIDTTAYSKEGVVKSLLDVVVGIVGSWSNASELSAVERCDGVAFSILGMLDGCNHNIPAIDLCVHPYDDKDYCNANNIRYFEPGRC